MHDLVGVAGHKRSKVQTFTLPQALRVEQPTQKTRPHVHVNVIGHALRAATIQPQKPVAVRLGLQQDLPVLQLLKIGLFLLAEDAVRTLCRKENVPELETL